MSAYDNYFFAIHMQIKK